MTTVPPAERPDLQTVWLVPTVDRPVHLAQTLGALRSRAIPYVVVDRGEVRERLGQARLRAAIVHGGPVSPILLEVQRWLADHAVPTLLLVEGLTDLYEASLIDRGAHDALSLPVSSRVLGSRVQALLRVPRAAGWRPPGGSLVLSSSLVVDLGRRLVAVRGKDLPLTRLQFRVFLVLAMRAGRVVTRSEIAKAVGQDTMSSRSLESHVSRLRLQLREAGAATTIRAVRGVGYVLEVSGHEGDDTAAPGTGGPRSRSLHSSMRGALD
ncbi:MAG: hypothetical protein DCC50_02490 [Acidobacteria bacterium]|nr:MAG: hypothetical protein DCC50_02490 [Acidobacteriota bacterium]